MQERLVHNLKNNKVKWIISDTRDKRGLVDGLRLEQRLPVVRQYLQRNYTFKTSINGVDLFLRN